MRHYIKPLLAVLCCSAAPAFAVPTLNPANDHYYELVTPASGITWTSANAAANASSYLGYQGHLVTFSSQAEFNFATATFPAQPFVWIGFTDAASEGNFQWVTGEPVVFTAWLANEPNNAASGAGEDYAWYENRFGWGWNDYQNLSATVGSNVPIHYLVEYDVPEPAALALFAGALPIVALRRRKR